MYFGMELFYSKISIIFIEIRQCTVDTYRKENYKVHDRELGPKSVISFRFKSLATN